MAEDFQPSYEIVVLVEATANLVSHWDAIKKLYITPAIQHFHKLSGSDFLCSIPTNQYGLVLFHAADKTPDSLTECFPPCQEPHTFMQMLDSICFIGGGGEHYSYIAEGLATTLQLFQDMESSRRGSISERFCFLVCSSPPYQQSSIESLNYSGFNTKQLAEKLKDVEVKLSVICPRHINELQQVYLSASGPQTTLMNYGQDRRHLVLISGFNLPTEKDPVPVSESTSEEKVSSASILNDIIIPMDVTPSVTEIPAATTAISSESVSIAFTKSVSNTTSKALFGSNVSTTNSSSSSLLSQNFIAPNSSSSVVSQNNFSVAPLGTVQTPYSSTIQNEQSSTNISTTSRSTLFSSPLIRPNIAPSQGGISQASTSMLPNVRMPVTQPSLPMAKTGTPAPYKAAKEEADKVVKMLNKQVNASEPGLKPIWSGIVEWIDKRHAANPMSKVTMSANCQIMQSSSLPEINTANWASKVNMQLVPQVVISHTAVQPYVKSIRQVLLNFSLQDSQQILNVFMSKNVRGLIQLIVPAPENKIVIVVIPRRKDDKPIFLGLLPNDPTGFFNAVRGVAASLQPKKRAEGSGGVMPGQTHDPNTQGGMQQMMQSNISSASTVLQQNNNLMSDPNINMSQYRTQVQPQQPQQFQNRPFQNQDLGISSNQPRMGQMNPNATNMSKIINMPMSSSQNQMPIQPSGSNIMHDQMSDGGKILGGIRNITGGGNTISMGNNLTSSQVNLSGGQGGMAGSQRGIPGPAGIAMNNSNRQGLGRMTQIRAMRMQGNRPVSQEPLQLRSLLNSNNNPMQPTPMNIRQQSNPGIRQTVSNNIQPQNYLRGSNMMPSMQNQRPY